MARAAESGMAREWWRCTRTWPCTSLRRCMRPRVRLHGRRATQDATACLLIVHPDLNGGRNCAAQEDAEDGSLQVVVLPVIAIHACTNADVH